MSLTKENVCEKFNDYRNYNDGQFLVETKYNPKKLKVLLICESPHSNEVEHKIPLMGDSGKNVSSIIIGSDEKPFGRIVEDDKDSIFGIMNCVEVPMQSNDSIGNHNFQDDKKELLEILFDLRNESFFVSKRDEEKRELKKCIYSDFELRLRQIIQDENITHIVSCGTFAQSILSKYIVENGVINSTEIIELPHPATSYWKGNLDDIRDKFNILKKLGSSK